MSIRNLKKLKNFFEKDIDIIQILCYNIFRAHKERMERCPSGLRS